MSYQPHALVNDHQTYYRNASIIIWLNKQCNRKDVMKAV